MRCISLWQPWASFWAWGIKIHETRGWHTNYRGELLIHAAKRKADAEDLEYYEDIFELIGKTPKDLVYGALIGRGNLVACKRTEVVQFETTKIDLVLGDFSDGRFAWELRDVQEFAQPIPYRGSQGFFDVPRDILLPAVGSVVLPTVEPLQRSLWS